ncbi:MAG: class IV adenylate cyclase, partial [Gammaproteobacteria bacterium]|nr:class IV adenylate cyclase [Gammaproteobacteria bacterium]
TGELIYYAREDTPDPTGSTYQISPTNDPKGLCVLLRDALGSRGDIEKIRYLYMSGRTRIHVDSVKELGSFLELEVVLNEGEKHSTGIAEANNLMNLLSVKENQLIDCAYIDLKTGDAQRA